MKERKIERQKEKERDRKKERKIERKKETNLILTWEFGSSANSGLGSLTKVTQSLMSKAMSMIFSA